MTADDSSVLVAGLNGRVAQVNPRDGVSAVTIRNAATVVREGGLRGLHAPSFAAVQSQDDDTATTTTTVQAGVLAMAAWDRSQWAVTSHSDGHVRVWHTGKGAVDTSRCACCASCGRC